VLHIAHSGGAILTYLAAKYHLTYAESNRIDVVTLGGGRSLTHKYFKGRIFNYYARNDPVLMLEKRASDLMKVVVAMKTNETYDAVRDNKHNTTFVFMQPIAKDPLMDHSMYGPTYRLALSWEAVDYQKRLQDMMLLAARENDIIRRIRKHSANLTGYHHFWTRGYNYYWGQQETTVITPHVNFALTGRWIRKYAANITNMHGLFSDKHPTINATTGVLWPNITTYIHSVFRGIMYRYESTATNATYLLGSSSVGTGLQWLFSGSGRSRGNQSIIDMTSILPSEFNDTEGFDVFLTGQRNQSDTNALRRLNTTTDIIPADTNMMTDDIILESNNMLANSQYNNNVDSSNILSSFDNTGGSSVVKIHTMSNWEEDTLNINNSISSSYYSSFISCFKEATSRMASYCIENSWSMFENNSQCRGGAPSDASL